MASMRLTWTGIPVRVMILFRKQDHRKKTCSGKNYHTHMDSNIIVEEAGGVVGGVAHAHHVPDILPLERL